MEESGLEQWNGTLVMDPFPLPAMHSQAPAACSLQPASKLSCTHHVTRCVSCMPYAYLQRFFQGWKDAHLAEDGHRALFTHSLDHAYNEAVDEMQKRKVRRRQYKARV